MENNIIQVDEDFNIYIPIDFEKSETCKKTGRKRMTISGVASTMTKDSDGEILDPNGFDMSYFLNKGHINWNHQVKENPLAIIGEPTEGKIIDNKMMIKGWLYDDNDLAKKVYKLAEILQKSGSERRLGLSIEGKVTERDALNKKYIKKAKVRHLAIAPTPKNADTVMEIEKSIVNQWEFDKSDDGFILDESFNGERVTINDKFEIDITKSDDNCNHCTECICKKGEVDNGINNKGTELSKFIKAISDIYEAYEAKLIDEDTIKSIREQMKNVEIPELILE